MNVCFVVTGEFITNHARNLMKEGRPDAAMNVLDCLDGMSAGQKMDVLEGRAKLVGDSSAGITLENDETEMPSLKKTVESIVKERDQAKREARWAQELACGETAIVGSPTGARTIPRSVANLKGNGLQAKYAWDDFPQPGCEPFSAYRHGAKISGPFIRPSTLADQVEEQLDDLDMPQRMKEAIKNKAAELDQPAPPDVDLTYVRKCQASGWLSPDGKFYPCPYWGHENLALALVEEEYDDHEGHGGSIALERRGWVKFAKSSLTDEQLILGFLDRDNKIKPTAGQIRMTVDFCLETGCEFPYWCQPDLTP